MLPVDDLLTSEAGVIKLASYQLVGPQGTKVDLGLPDAAVQPKKQTALGLSVQTGDLGLRKIGLTGKQKPGTYQVVAQTQPLYFTMYVDKNGKKAMAPKPMDQIKNASRVLSSMKYPPPPPPSPMPRPFSPSRIGVNRGLWAMTWRSCP